MALTKEQIAENVKKIRAAEALIQKYVKGYKLSEEEVQQMAAKEGPLTSDRSELLAAIRSQNDYRLVMTWFASFKKHLEKSGIDVNNKFDLMKIRTCTIPDFEKGEDMRNGELGYPCSDMPLAPTDEEFQQYQTLRNAELEQGELIFQLGMEQKANLDKKDFKAASETMEKYKQQVEIAKKAEEKLAEFKANVFGKHFENLTNSMSFPKDDEYDKIERLFNAAQKMELYIEDDPLKEGEYHMLYVNSEKKFVATPIAKEIGPGHPMQVAMMNLDKAKGYAAAYNGKLYDEQFLIDRAAMGAIILTNKEKVLGANGANIEVKTDNLKSVLYDDEAESIDADLNRNEAKLKNTVMTERIKQSLQYQEQKIQGLKEAVENSYIEATDEQSQKSNKAILDMLNKESIHYLAVKDLMGYVDKLKSGAKPDEKSFNDICEKMAMLSVVREYKLTKPEQYATLTAEALMQQVDKIKNYNGFQEACKSLNSKKLLSIIDGEGAKNFSKEVYEKVQQLDILEQDEQIVKPAENKEIKTERTPMMPFI